MFGSDRRRQSQETTRPSACDAGASEQCDRAFRRHRGAGGTRPQAPVGNGARGGSSLPIVGRCASPKERPIVTTRKTAETRKAAKPAARAPQPVRKGAGRAATAPTLRAGTKQAKLIALLRRPEGVTLAQAVKATGWQPHTVRGAMCASTRRVAAADRLRIISAAVTRQRAHLNLLKSEDFW
jgi:hypothetical protein